MFFVDSTIVEYLFINLSTYVMAKQAMIAVKPHTRDRIFLYKRAGVSYDTIISAMVDAYEEKLNEHRPQSAKTSEAGNHEGDQ